MSLTLLAFMKAFPGTHCWVSSQPDDAWEIGRLCGPLPSGANEWAEKHNIVFKGMYGGYMIRWLKNPDDEKKGVETMMRFFTGQVFSNKEQGVAAAYKAYKLLEELGYSDLT